MHPLDDIVMAKHWVTYGVAGQLTALLFFGRCALLGALLGFLVYEMCSAPNTGERNRIERLLCGARVSVRFSVRGVYFHLHHWLLSLALLLLLHAHEQSLLAIASERVVYVLYGSCIGGTAQGLRYKDRLKLVWWKHNRRASVGSEHELLHESDNLNEIDEVEIELIEEVIDDDKSLSDMCGSGSPTWLMELGNF